MIYAVLGFAVAALGAITALALVISKTKDQREAARVLASSTGGELRSARETIERLTVNLKSEQERADALYDRLAESYSDPAPTNARELVLQAWRTEHNAARGRTVALSAPPTTTGTRPSDDDLLRPGE